MGLWSSGYDVASTWRISPVRIWSGPLFYSEFLKMQRSFKKLVVWKIAQDFALETGKIAKKIADPVISNQLRLASISISSYISKGAAMKSERDFLKFINLAAGSVNECENLLIFAKDLNYLDAEEFNSLTSESEKLRAMLFKLMESISSQNSK